ncbi:LPS assembly lipoprotein LptE [Roseobacter weihaiensis]|uniref:LPS assembly lipoprotein LptE n=1 Tax=Roseobacter weihaiensis TaxID=2763262 RepID=UPI001D0BE0D8|nr:LPS assembly lipoprotein LptE [Roseobacter sp. H9]
MSLYNRRALLALPLALAACGFTPVYAPGGSGSALQNSVEVVEQNNANVYMVNRRIEERVGRASVPKYRLSLDIRTFSETLAVDSESNINRFNIIGEADYTLVEQATGRVVTSGKVDNFTGASATGTTVATLAARRDARERLMTLLADQIVVRLLSTDLT